MNKGCLLDASAVLARLNDEPGSEALRSVSQSEFCENRPSDVSQSPGRAEHSAADSRRGNAAECGYALFCSSTEQGLAGVGREDAGQQLEAAAKELRRQVPGARPRFHVVPQGVHVLGQGGGQRDGDVIGVG